MNGSESCEQIFPNWRLRPLTSSSLYGVKHGFGHHDTFAEIPNDLLYWSR